jgi:hypothetical protein
MRPLTAITFIMSLAAITATTAGASEVPRSPANASIIASLTPSVPEWSRPLSITAEDSRLVGEAANREFPIYLTAGEASRMAKFQLAYRNAISVMPETFRLTVRINDIVVGESTVQSAAQPEVLTMNVPVGVLQTGFNAVRVSIRQTHRVDCSVDSTYELWTQVLPEQSAFTFAGASGEIRSLQDLPAIASDHNGMTAIRVWTPGNSEPGEVNQAARAVQAVALLGRFTHPKVELASELRNEAGLDVVVGTASAIERSMGLRVPGIGARHQIQHDVQTGNVMLIITGDTDAQVEATLDALAQQAQRMDLQGSAAGLRATRNVNGIPMEGGETISLADLGLESEPFRGRLHRQTVRIQMPSDLLAADYDRVVLSADAIYAAGLLPTSKMTIRVNGTAIADAPMSNSGGDVLSKKSFYLPVSTFKPGLNTIDFEAETRTSADETCSLEALMDQRERFLLSGTSQISIPTLGRVGALPNISSILPGGLSRLSGANDLTVFVPKARHEAVETALTTLAKMATVSGRETKARFTFDIVPSGTKHVLALGAYDDMPEATLRDAGLDAEKLRRVWRQTAPKSPAVAGGGQLVQVASIGETIEIASSLSSGKGHVESTGSVGKSALKDSQAQSSSMMNVFGQSGGGWLGGYAKSMFGAFSGLASEMLGKSGTTQFSGSSDLPLNEGSTLVVAQGAKADGMGDGWRGKLLPNVSSTTVFVAPSPERLSQSVNEVLSGSLWQQFVGDAAVYTAKDNAVSTRVSSQILLVPTASFSLQNIRLIAAGWLSHNVTVYLSVLLVLFVIMTAFMQWTLRSSGVREP